MMLPRVAVAGWLCAMLAEPVLAARVNVHFDVPAAEVESGTMFRIPVGIEDGPQDVVSYAFVVRYDPLVLHLVDITGGTFEGFDAAPVWNPASFKTGATVFTALNESFTRTPAMFNVATLTFAVVGHAGDRTAIVIRRSPGTDVTLRKGFGSARVRFPRVRRIAVRATESSDGPE